MVRGLEGRQAGKSDVLLVGRSASRKVCCSVGRKVGKQESLMFCCSEGRQAGKSDVLLFRRSASRKV